MVYVNNTTYRQIPSLQADLVAHGLTLPDEALAPITNITFPAPTATEIAEAVLEAKGNPAADKTVQTLVTASYLATHQALITDYVAAQAKDRVDAAKAATPELCETVRAMHAERVTTLEEVYPALSQYGNPEHIILADVPARLLTPAERAVTAVRTARSLRKLWGRLHAYRTGSGVDLTGRHGRAVLSNPSMNNLTKALTQRPVVLPEPTEWDLIAHGWTVDLARTPRAGAERYAELVRTFNTRNETK